jgi:hypothetical protein
MSLNWAAIHRVYAADAGEQLSRATVLGIHGSAVRECYPGCRGHRHGTGVL